MANTEKNDNQEQQSVTGGMILEMIRQAEEKQKQNNKDQ